MHRITLPDGTSRQSQFLRWGRSTAYALFSAAGVLLLLSELVPPFYGDVGVVMSWFLMIGGGLACVGSATSRWVGEFCGLPLLAPAFVVFGVLVWRTSVQDAPLIAAANLCLLTAIGVVMVVRWRVVLAIFQFVQALARTGP
jgi:hypothetical protein